MNITSFISVRNIGWVMNNASFIYVRNTGWVMNITSLIYEKHWLGDGYYWLYL